MKYESGQDFVVPPEQTRTFTHGRENSTPHLRQHLSPARLALLSLYQRNRAIRRRQQGRLQQRRTPVIRHVVERREPLRGPPVAALFAAVVGRRARGVRRVVGLLRKACFPRPGRQRHARRRSVQLLRRRDAGGGEGNPHGYGEGHKVDDDEGDAHAEREGGVAAGQDVQEPHQVRVDVQHGSEDPVHGLHALNVEAHGREAPEERRRPRLVPHAHLVCKLVLPRQQVDEAAERHVGRQLLDEPVQQRLVDDAAPVVRGGHHKGAALVACDEALVARVEEVEELAQLCLAPRQVVLRARARGGLEARVAPPLEVGHLRRLAADERQHVVRPAVLGDVRHDEDDGDEVHDVHRRDVRDDRHVRRQARQDVDAGQHGDERDSNAGRRRVHGDEAAHEGHGNHQPQLRHGRDDEASLLPAEHPDELDGGEAVVADGAHPHLACGHVENVRRDGAHAGVVVEELNGLGEAVRLEGDDVLHRVGAVRVALNGGLAVLLVEGVPDEVHRAEEVEHNAFRPQHAAVVGDADVLLAVGAVDLVGVGEEGVRHPELVAREIGDERGVAEVLWVPGKPGVHPLLPKVHVELERLLLRAELVYFGDRARHLDLQGAERRVGVVGCLEAVVGAQELLHEVRTLLCGAGSREERRSGQRSEQRKRMHRASSHVVREGGRMRKGSGRGEGGGVFQ
eukprot:Rhum_TRINITY_DN14896_c0_g1::Rhum_TRINITY_DN14896_c0_g1_i1::g.125081::m.125081